MPKKISMTCTKEERALIELVALRFLKSMSKRTKINYKAIHHRSVEMSLAACHANGCPLRLQDLAECSEIPLTRDVMGVCDNLDQKTGLLANDFWPEFAKPVEKGEGEIEP